MTLQEVIDILEMFATDKFQRCTSSEFDDAIYVAIEALEKQKKPKWNKTSEIKPTEEKEYLCCSIYTNRPHFTVLGWSNDLYEVSCFDFYGHKGESGFYYYNSEWGYIKYDCDYWQEIDWSDEE